MALECSCDPSRGAARLVGSLDLYSVESLRTTLLQLLERGSEWRLDLDGVGACDAAGLQLLLAAQKAFANAGIHLRLASASEAILESCRRAGLCPEVLTPIAP